MVGPMNCQSVIRARNVNSNREPCMHCHDTARKGAGEPRSQIESKETVYDGSTRGECGSDPESEVRSDQSTQFARASSGRTPPHEPVTCLVSFHLGDILAWGEDKRRHEWSCGETRQEVMRGKGTASGRRQWKERDHRAHGSVLEQSDFYHAAFAWRAASARTSRP
jgi:hypothetical protein